MEILKKQMKKIFLIFSLLLLLTVPCFGANTVTAGPGSIMISVIDSDWTAPTYYSVFAVIFIPGATNDVAVIKSVSDTGPELTTMKSTDGEARITYFDGLRLKPMLDYSASTLNSGARILIIIK